MVADEDYDALLSRLVRIGRGEIPVEDAEIEGETNERQQELLVALKVLHEDLQAQAEIREELAEAQRQRELADERGRAAAERAEALSNALGELAMAHAHLREANEALERKGRMEVMGEVAAGVAHDFNNMLMGLMGLVLEMKTVTQDPEITGRVEELADTVLRSRRISMRLLDFGRKRAEHDVPDEVDVQEVVDQSARLLRHTLGDDIELVLERSEQPVPVRIDPGDVERILFNLVVNARDAIEGRGEVSLSVRAKGEFCVLAVRDTGAGMTPEILARIFEPLFTTKPIGIGSGVGLSSTRAIVDAVGGNVAVDSDLGKGTTVTIEMPIADPAGASA